MTLPTDNGTWLIELGDEIIHKQAAGHSLSDWEALVYNLWAADYGMRNAGDLETAADLASSFQEDVLRLSTELSLPKTMEAFSLSRIELERVFLARFEDICDEIKASGARQ